MRNPVRTELRPPRKNSPSIALVSSGEKPCVEKSYSQCPLWLRQTVGRLAIQRECWALERLAFSSHAPRLLARPNSHTMVSSYIEGRALELLGPQDLDFHRLREQAESALSDLEQAKLVHGDIGHDHWQTMGRETNLIWTSDQTLVMVDFANALALGSSIPVFKKLTAALHQHDRLMLTKIDHHFAGPQEQPATRSQARDWPLGLWELLRLLGKL